MTDTWTDQRVRTPAGRDQIRREMVGYPQHRREQVEAEMMDIERALERAA